METPKMNTYQAKIGYARTSTVDQTLDAQIAALKAAGCGMVRTEQKSGASLEGRPELRTILDFIHSGETLVVTRIDRLARSLSDLQTIVTQLNSKGAHLAATEQPVDTSNATGKAFFDMLGVFAEFETNLRRERQAEGISAAKQRGVYRGRKSRIDMAALQAKLADGLSPTEIARDMMKACLTVAETHGLTVEGGELGDIDLRHGFNIGFRGGIPMEDGAVSSPGKAMFEVPAPHFGLEPADYGRTFPTGGDLHRIVGINPNRPKYPISTERVSDGRGFRMPAENVAMYLQKAGT